MKTENCQATMPLAPDTARGEGHDNLTNHPVTKKTSCRYTTQVLIDQVVKMTAELGRIPTLVEFGKNPATASGTTIIYRFGSWNNFLGIAGLKPNRRRYSDEELISQVLALATELGKTPTCEEFKRDTRYADIGAIYRRFGSWNRFIEQAGLKSYRRSYITNEELIEDVRMMAKELGRRPFAFEFSDDPRTASASTAISRFGSWTEFLTAADLDHIRPCRISDQEIIGQIQTMAQQLGRAPLAAEFGQSPNTVCLLTVVKRFGSWNASLIVAGLTPRRSSQLRKTKGIQQSPTIDS